MVLPDYRGGAIVNLMASIAEALGASVPHHAPLRDLPPARLAAARHLVLIVIDGLGDALLARLGGTLHAHRHARLTSVFPSTTATAITTFLTGLAPQQHGLTGWHVYFEELDTIAAVLPFRARNGAPLGERGITARTLFAHAPVFDRLDVPAYVVAPTRIIDSDFNLAHTGRARRRPYTTLREFFDATVKCVCNQAERNYTYAYYPEIDRLAHEYGSASRAVETHFAELDAAFGKFLQRMAGTDTTVLLTADHGFIDSPPERQLDLADHPQLAETLSLPLCGERRAAYCYVHSDKRDRFEDYVKTHLAEQASLRKSGDLIAQGYFGLGPPHPQLAARTGHYTLLMKENYAIKDWLPNERRYRQIGLHGGVSEAEMFVPLVVVDA